MEQLFFLFSYFLPGKLKLLMKQYHASTVIILARDYL
jgi:hypothetical protein